MRTALRAEARPRDVWVWAIYDFANSGYTTVVVAAAGASWATLAWTGALAVSYLAILASAPVTAGGRHCVPSVRLRRNPA